MEILSESMKKRIAAQPGLNLNAMISFMLRGRMDLRAKRIFTIDPATAKDDKWSFPHFRKKGALLEGPHNQD